MGSLTDTLIFRSLSYMILTLLGLVPPHSVTIEAPVTLSDAPDSLSEV